jgi:DnaJ-class molecular chaperone
MGTHRIIVTGKNRDFPNTVRMPFGVGVDGRVISVPMQIRANEIKCPRCEGWGEYEAVRCTTCDGDGIVTREVAA